MRSFERSRPWMLVVAFSVFAAWLCLFPDSSQAGRGSGYRHRGHGGHRHHGHSGRHRGFGSYGYSRRYSGIRGGSYGYRSGGYTGYRGGSYGYRSGGYGGRYYSPRSGYGYGSTYGGYSSPRYYGYSYPRYQTPYYGGGGYAYSGARYGSLPNNSYNSQPAPPTGGYAATAPYSANRPVGTSGWSLLAEGRYPSAAAAFGQQAQLSPQAGEPKVGYALAAAAAGDLETGLWAMRRACRLDPQSMETIALDANTQPVVEGLVSRYEVAQTNGAPFMQASLHALLRQWEPAQHAINVAVTGGDRQASTVNLKRMLDGRVARRIESPPGQWVPPTQQPPTLGDGGGYPPVLQQEQCEPGQMPPSPQGPPSNYGAPAPMPETPIVPPVPEPYRQREDLPSRAPADPPLPGDPVALADEPAFFVQYSTSL